MHNVNHEHTNHFHSLVGSRHDYLANLCGFHPHCAQYSIDLLQHFYKIKLRKEAGLGFTVVSVLLAQVARRRGALLDTRAAGMAANGGWQCKAS